jgi:hypothetical protein
MFRIYNERDHRVEMTNDTSLVELLAEFGNGNLASPLSKKYTVQQRNGAELIECGVEWRTLLTVTVWATKPG